MTYPTLLLALAAAAPASSPPATVEAAAPPPVVSERLAHPFSVSGAFNLPMLNVGIDLSYQVLDRLAVGVQATTFLLAHTDLSVRTRVFLIARPRWGIYLGANGHYIHSPLILSDPTWAATGELGWEYRTPGRTVIAVGAGAGRFWARDTEGSNDCRTCPWQSFWPLLNLRVGRAR
jgi:hypothetical protein